MAVLVVENVVECTAMGTVSGRPWASVWHIANAPSWWTAGSPVDEVCRDFANNFQDHIMQGLSNAVSLTGFSYLSLHTADGSTGTMAPDPAKKIVGAATAEAAPPNVAYLVRKRGTSARGKRSGRAYLPGVHETLVSSAGVLTAAHITAINNLLTLFLDGINNAGGGTDPERQLVTVHRPKEARIKGPQVVTGSYSPVTALTVDSMVATQRRRLRG